MPLYFLGCPCGSPVVKCLADSSKQAIEKLGPCPSCSTPRIRTPKPPTANVYESLDSGWQTRRVIRLSEVDRLNKERSRIDHTDGNDDK